MTSLKSRLERLEGGVKSDDAPCKVLMFSPDDDLSEPEQEKQIEQFRRENEMGDDDMLILLVAAKMQDKGRMTE